MKAWLTTEDGWAVWIGLLVVGLALLAPLGLDAMGWAVKTSDWADLGKAFAPVSKSFAWLTGVGSLVCTYLFLLVVMGIGARVMAWPLRKFLLSFSVVFWISMACYLIGHYGYIAATPDKLPKLGISWSLGLTGEAGYIVALLAGLCLGNFFPRATAGLKEAARSEWFVKTAIVIMGASLGVKAVADPRLTTAIMFRGFAAIVEAYLIYWAVVYFLARKVFKFSREWAAPLASGISICGVSAAIATGAAIRARPIVPVMVSSLVVVFSVVELLLLPFAARTFLYMEPLVAAAWLGLAIKTDGAGVSSGAMAEALISARAAEAGIVYDTGWIALTTASVKIFIDVFIGIWAFVLALVWVYGIDKKPGEKVPVRAILDRFPKFVLGYAFAFVALLAITLNWPALAETLRKTTMEETEVFRRLFFVMTFFTIGLASNFRRLWAEGIGRLALVYVISLFGFIIWVGLVISWIFFQGVHPPTIP